MVFYFAYGSNMDLRRMKSRGIVVKSKRAGVLNNWKLVFNVVAERPGAAHANIVEDDSRVVEGVVYDVPLSDIKKLDHYEIYPIEYVRKKLKICGKNNEMYDCIVYIGTKEKTKDGLKPTRVYLSKLLRGKKFLSSKYYDLLKGTETL